MKEESFRTQSFICQLRSRFRKGYSQLSGYTIAALINYENKGGREFYDPLDTELLGPEQMFSVPEFSPATACKLSLF